MYHRFSLAPADSVPRSGAPDVPSPAQGKRPHLLDAVELLTNLDKLGSLPWAVQEYGRTVEQRWTDSRKLWLDSWTARPEPHQCFRRHC